MILFLSNKSKKGKPKGVKIFDRWLESDMQQKNKLQ